MNQQSMNETDRGQLILEAHECISMRRYQLVRLQKKLEAARTARDKARRQLAALKEHVDQAVSDRCRGLAGQRSSLDVKVSELTALLKLARAQITALENGDPRGRTNPAGGDV